MSDPQQMQNKEISVSILRRRLRKFKSIKRGYYSFLLLTTLYIISFLLPVLINSKALVVKYDGQYYFPVFHGYYSAETFDQEGILGETNYREMKERFKKEGKGNWMILPIYPYDPIEDISVDGNEPFQPPGTDRILGTDDRGRDVFARMAYGFNISISFALLLTLVTYTIGTSIGACMGYFGKKFDLFFQRLIEIWMTMPFLFMVIIVSSVIRPNFILLVCILVIFRWMLMTFYMRAEFYREKSKDYVAAAIAMGQTHPKIIFKHIFPNALTPIITFFPFSTVQGIAALVGLDFLGFGLPPPTPSWGQMVSVGLSNISQWWLTLVPLGALFLTLLLIVFIGEALREAFDPKVYSRLR